MPKIKPLWAKKVEKKLIDKEMTKKKLSEEIGVSPQQVSAVMSGYILSDTIAKKICNHMGIEY